MKVIQTLCTERDGPSTVQSDPRLEVMSGNCGGSIHRCNMCDCQFRRQASIV